MNAVITGLGCISGAGQNRAEMRAALRCGLAPRVTWAAKPPAIVHAREVVQITDFQPDRVLGRKGLQFMSRGSQMLLCAAKEAIETAGWTARSSSQLGVIVGTNFAGLRSIAAYDHTVLSEGPQYVSPMEAPNTLANAPASHLSIRSGAQALNVTLSSGCCASLDAITLAAEFVAADPARVLIAAGTEEVNASVLWQYAALGLIPAGGVPGEAAAALVIEDAMAAQRRGASSLASVLGWANCLAPRAPTAQRVSAVCAEAMGRAGVAGCDLGLVVLGLNGDPNHDQSLATGLTAVLGQRARPIPAFSLKGAVGETYGAAGALHVVAAVDALMSGAIPGSAPASDRLGQVPLVCSRDPDSWKPGVVLVLENDVAGYTTALVIGPPTAEPPNRSD